MLNSKERIIEASFDLFIRKGYKGTTTKTIAKAAGVNELTVFRQFGTKEGILRAIIDDRLSYIRHAVASIGDELDYDIATDFPKLAKLYNEKLAESFGLVVLFLNDDELEEETVRQFRQIPQTGKQFLIDYFTEFKRKNRLRFDPETAALTYMSMNFGYLVMKQKLFSDFTAAFTTNYLDISVDTFLKCLE
jgi:AcrR family transcriptional regulator